MEETKKTYELAVLLSLNVEEKDAPSYLEKLLPKCEMESPRRIRLAYPIDKIEEAYFISYTFDANGEEIVKIEKELEGMSDVIRHLIIKKAKEKELKEEPKKEDESK